MHPCFCISFLEIFNDFRPYGYTEHHYVLDLFLGFFRSLAMLNGLIITLFSFSIYMDLFSTCSISMF